MTTMDKFLKYKVFAQAAASLSKHPKVKVGAVILDDDCNILSVGYNGLPRGVTDTQERLYNDAIRQDAEVNAIAQAARNGVRLSGSTMIVTGITPNALWAGVVIQAGVKRVIAPKIEDSEYWLSSYEHSRVMLREAGVEVYLFEV